MPLPRISPVWDRPTPIFPLGSAPDRPPNRFTETIRIVTLCPVRSPADSPANPDANPDANRDANRDADNRTANDSVNQAPADEPGSTPEPARPGGEEIPWTNAPPNARSSPN